MRRICFFLALLLSATIATRAQTFTLTKIVESGMPAPGGNAGFMSFGDPTCDHGEIVFRADYGSGNRSTGHGVYRYAKGKLEKVIDQRTQFPHKGFWEVDAMSSIADGGDVVATAEMNAPKERRVVYRVRRNGAISPLFDPATDLRASPTLPKISGKPGAKPDYDWNISNVFLENQAFSASAYSQALPDYSAILMGKQGTAQIVLDSTYMVPGINKSVSYFESPMLDGNHVDVLAHFGKQPGDPVFVLRADGKSVSKVFGSGDKIPGGDRVISSMRTLSSDGGQVCVQATDGKPSGASTYNAIVVHDGQALKLVADTTMKMPGREDPFYGFEQYDCVLDAGRVFFTGVKSADVFAQIGLYLWDGTTVRKVLDSDDPLEGKKIHYIRISRKPLAGNTLVFLVAFSDKKTWAMYTTQVGK